MELHDLRIFVAVATEGGFTKAAEKLHYVQPNITARVKKLEEEVKVKLFYREKRKVILTSYGEQLLIKARQLIKMADDIQDIFTDEKPSGILNIGVTQTAATAWLPEILKEYTREYPDVKINVQSLFVETITCYLLNHEIDCALMDISIDNPLLNYDFYTKQQLMIVYSKEYTCYPTKKITALAFSKNCTYRKTMYDYFIDNNIQVKRELTLKGMDAVIACIIGGVGVSLLPEAITKMPHIAPHIHAIPLGNKSSWKVGILTHKNNVPSCQQKAFSEVAKRVLNRKR